MRLTWRGLAGALVIAAAAMLYSTPVVRVTTAPVSVGPIARNVVATGTLQAATTVDVGAQVSGLVQSLDADYNSIVHAGDIIARLDPSIYDAAVHEAQAAIDEARADLDAAETAWNDAQIKFDRAHDLSVDNLIPRADADAARAALDAAAADVQDRNAALAAASAALEQTRADAARTIIRSPIDGIVIARNVDVGQMVAASLQAPTLFRIATDLSDLRLQVDVDESDVAAVHDGDRVSFSVESYPDERFGGTVLQVHVQPASAASETGTIGAVIYAAMVDVANTDLRLRPGMTATVTFRELLRDNVTRIPNAALAFHPTADVLAATGEALRLRSGQAHAAPRPAKGSIVNTYGAVREIWQYDGSQFEPIAVRTGLADSEWTELVSGTPGDGERLVTSASIEQRHALW